MAPLSQTEFDKNLSSEQDMTEQRPARALEYNWRGSWKVTEDDLSDVKLTKHANTRSKQRLGLQKHCRVKDIEDALHYGLSEQQVTGKLRDVFKSCKKKNPNATNIRIYHRHIYIFNEKLVCITIMPLRSQYAKLEDICKEKQKAKMAGKEDEHLNNTISCPPQGKQRHSARTYCSHCDDYTTYYTLAHIATMRYKGITFSYLRQTAFCKHCNSPVYASAVTDANAKERKVAYNLALEAVIKIRKQKRAELEQCKGSEACEQDSDECNRGT